MLSRIERLNSTFSCSTEPTWRRSQDDVGHRQIDAVDQHAAGLRHVKPLHQLGQGRLARAGGTDDADDLPGRNGQRDVVQARAVHRADTESVT